jgi:hypothetical protein
VKSLLRCLSVSALALLVLGAVSAEEKKKADDKKPAAFAAVFAFPKAVTLSDDQQKKVEELKKEYTPKLEEMQKKLAGIMTPERQKAQKEALDKAKADGKKGKDLTEAGMAALKLTEAESKQLAETRTAQTKLTDEIKKKKMELLTEEQKKALQPKPKN